jgi:hypothetical protein
MFQIFPFRRHVKIHHICENHSVVFGCSEILKEQADKVNTTAQLLLEKEKIDSDEFYKLFEEANVITEENKDAE